MIIIRLNGGLGNQMFQYAMGRATSLHNNVNFKIDVVTGIHPNDTQRLYALGNFNIIEDFASKTEINNLKYPLGLLSKIYRFTRKKIFRQFYKGFDEHMFHVGDNAYLDGFWQSWKYFDDVADSIRKDFTLKNSLSDRAKKIADAMQQVNAVSVHVRRGDYVSNATLQRNYGVCSETYYHKAIDAMYAQVENPVFFVFSDDIAWIKSHQSLFSRSQEHENKNPKIFYVSDYHLPDYEELMLMASCKHHIIANSSFSWWGAWLDSNKEKIVIAPKVWFKKKSLVPKDLLPPSWIQF